MEQSAWVNLTDDGGARGGCHLPACWTTHGAYLVLWHQLVHDGGLQLCRCSKGGGYTTRCKETAAKLKMDL